MLQSWDTSGQPTKQSVQAYRTSALMAMVSVLPCCCTIPPRHLFARGLFPCYTSGAQRFLCDDWRPDDLTGDRQVGD
jgi:hypothetical protein